MIEMKVDGIEKIDGMARKMATLMSPASIEARVLQIANRAGVALKAAVVRSCLEQIYDQPELTYERTNALLDSHRLRTEDGGMTQIVDIDMEMPVYSDAHAGREVVGDYAGYVHNGYTQWVYGYDTGIFFPGKFWMDAAAQEAGPVLIAFIKKAFEEVVTILIHEVAA